MTHIERTLDTDPQANWIFVCDQLNTHQTARLVEFVAQRGAIDTPLGRKGKTGILQEPGLKRRLSPGSLTLDFFNRTLAKPFRWTYIGKPQVA